MTPAPCARHLAWPAGEFYWAVLDTAVLDGARGGRKRARQLDYLFEAELPVPIDGVQAVYRPLSRDRCLACGIDRARLESLDGRAVTLSPDSIAPIVDTRIAPEAINLLTGPFTPPQVRRLARRWRAGLLAVAVACAALAIAGMHRRGAAAEAEASRIEQATTGVLAGALEEAVTAAGLTRAQLNLRARLSELRQTRQVELPDNDADVSVTLAAILAAWPPGVAAQVETCAVTASTIVITGAVPATDDAQRLADALAPLAGWRLQQPSVESAGDEVRVTLRLARDTKADGP